MSIMIKILLLKSYRGLLAGSIFADEKSFCQTLIERGYAIQVPIKVPNVYIYENEVCIAKSDCKPDRFTTKMIYKRESTPLTEKE